MRREDCAAEPSELRLREQECLLRVGSGNWGQAMVHTDTRRPSQQPGCGAASGSSFEKGGEILHAIQSPRRSAWENEYEILKTEGVKGLK